MIEIRTIDFSGKIKSLVTDPKTLLIKAGFGAETDRCWVELYDQDKEIEIDEGYGVWVKIESQTQFYGLVSDIRTTTFGEILGFYANREPEPDLGLSLEDEYTNMTPTEILQEVVSNYPGNPIQYENLYPSNRVIEKLRFKGVSIFYAVDLLAKLAGNYLWDVNWDNKLIFRPRTEKPDKVLYYDSRFMELRIWETDRLIKNFFNFYGGVREDEGELFRQFASESSIGLYGPRKKSVFCRAITELGDYAYLQAAILEQMTVPGIEKFIDWHGAKFDFAAGDTVELRGNPLPQITGGNIFRIKELEISYSHQQFKIRMNLASRYESTSRYLKHFDHDVGESNSFYVEQRIGAFRLDHSALDSQAHLDA